MLREALKLSHVPRWGIIDKFKEQSVADHSYRVAIIAMELGEWLEEKGVKQLDWVRLYKEALLHDLHEHRSGDIPSNFKAHLRERVGLSMYRRLFPSVFTDHAYESAVVKIADLVESITWIERYGVKPKFVKQFLAPVLNAAVKDLKELTITNHQLNLGPFLVAKVREMVVEGCNYD